MVDDDELLGSRLGRLWAWESRHGQRSNFRYALYRARWQPELGSVSLSKTLRARMRGSSMFYGQNDSLKCFVLLLIAKHFVASQGAESSSYLRLFPHRQVKVHLKGWMPHPPTLAGISAAAKECVCC